MVLRGRKLSRRGALPDERAWSAADERAHTEQEESICAPWQLIPPSPPLVSCLSGAETLSAIHLFLDHCNHGWLGEVRSSSDWRQHQQTQFNP